MTALTVHGISVDVLILVIREELFRLFIVVVEKLTRESLDWLKCFFREVCLLQRYTIIDKTREESTHCIFSNFFHWHAFSLCYIISLVCIIDKAWCTYAIGILWFASSCNRNLIVSPLVRGGWNYLPVFFSKLMLGNKVDASIKSDIFISTSRGESNVMFI